LERSGQGSDFTRAADAGDRALIVDVNVVGGRAFRQAGHTENLSGDGDEESSTGCDLDLADGDDKVAGKPQEVRVIGEGLLGFSDADGKK